MQALLTVEAAQQLRPESAPMRIVAAVLYALVGAGEAALEALQRLEVKHIMHDSLTPHLALPVALPSCDRAPSQVPPFPFTSIPPLSHSRAA